MNSVDRSLESGADSSASYLRRLDLSADPFAADFESDYFYRGAMRQTTLEQVVHFSRFSEHIVMLLGATGSGSSRLLDEMLAQLHQIMDCCDIDGEQESTPEAILRSLAQQLQLRGDVDNLDNFIATLDEYDYIGEESEPLLVAIDQAHFLPAQSYEMLLALVQRAKGAIRMLFVGEYQCEQLAELAHYDRQQLKIFELPALSKEQTGEYVLGLLAVVGYAGELPLSADQLLILQERSGGNIAEINTLTAALLSFDPASEKTGLAFKIPIAHLAAIVILSATVGYVYWYLGIGEETPPLPQQQTVDRPLLELPALLSEGEESQGIPPAAQQQASAGASPQAAVTVPPAAVDVGTAIIIPGTDLSAMEPVVADETARQTSAQIVAAVVPLSLAPAAPAISAAAGARSAAEKALLALPAEFYLLQLTGTASEARMRLFVEKFSPLVALSYIELRRNGGPWYVALSGPQPTREAALQAVKSLPAELVRQQPWVRSVGSLQQALMAPGL